MIVVLFFYYLSYCWLVMMFVSLALETEGLYVVWDVTETAATTQELPNEVLPPGDVEWYRTPVPGYWNVDA
jgi:hypothetical protein